MLEPYSYQKEETHLLSFLPTTVAQASMSSHQHLMEIRKESKSNEEIHNVATHLAR